MFKKIICALSICLWVMVGSVSAQDNYVLDTGEPNVSCPDDGLFCTGSPMWVDDNCGYTGNPCSGETPICDEDNNTCEECLNDSDCDDGVCLDSNICYVLPDVEDDLQAYLSTLQEGDKAYKLLEKAKEALEDYLDAPEPKDKKALKNLGKVSKYIEKAGEAVPDYIAIDGLDAILGTLEKIADDISLEIDSIYSSLDEKDAAKLLKKHDAADRALGVYYDAKDTGDLATSKLAKLALKAIKKYTKALALGIKLSS